MTQRYAHLGDKQLKAAVNWGSSGLMNNQWFTSDLPTTYFDIVVVRSGSDFHKLEVSYKSASLTAFASVSILYGFFT